jgi:ornithine decarboxylase
MNQRIARFFEEEQPATPCLVVDLNVVAENYAAMRAALPDSDIFYAVKANPSPDVLKLLVGLGSNFDVASPAEIDEVLAAGAKATRISYGNTIKKQRDIAYAYAKGVRLYAFDSEAELKKIAEAAPGSRVFCRILTDNDGAEWPLSKKFGCAPEMARDLLARAPKMGLKPYGISFHVGSQQTDPGQWDRALEAAAKIFRDLADRGIDLDMVNLGGGFPTRYLKDIPAMSVYGGKIFDAIRQRFGNRIPRTIIEPGRGMVGNAGVIRSEVVLISKKSANDNKRWVYLDIGKFGGLAETMNEAIKYPITCQRGGEQGPVILAGPTCDSEDVLYEKTEYTLPLALEIGDTLTIHSAGAYTMTYASTSFNGFAPMKAYYIR